MNTVNLKQTVKLTINPEQYGLLAEMAKNRKVTENGVKQMKESVVRHGILRNVIVVWDEKKNKYFIVDGQHLVRAIKELGWDIPCLVVDCKSDAEITQLMIDLNNISRSWKIEDYIRGWKESGKKDYRILENARSIMYADIQVSVIIQAFTQETRSKATKMVKEGSFVVVDRERGEFYLDSVSDCNSFLPNTRQINEALIKLMLNVEDYNHKTFIKNLKAANKAKVQFSHTSEKQVYDELMRIYNK
jgi:hypothetical protein